MPTAASVARLEARISTDLHSMLKRAAELQGRTLTDFVVSAVQDAAQRTIEQAEVIRLSLADQECFAQALLSPPKPAPALERAFARRSKMLFAPKEGEVIEFEESTGNVYADIGQKDAAEMLVKAQLASKIGEIIKTRKWTQQEASDVLGLSQPKLSKMLRGQFRGISEAKMLDCLACLGRDVQIVVGPARRSVAVGRVAVVFAARSPQHRRSPQGL